MTQHDHGVWGGVVNKHLLEVGAGNRLGKKQKMLHMFTILWLLKMLSVFFEINKTESSSIKT